MKFQYSSVSSHNFTGDSHELLETQITLENEVNISENVLVSCRIYLKTNKTKVRTVGYTVDEKYYVTISRITK